uniref:IgLON family member 5 n=1 Tax=Oncorhynchus mykiss TaxID=8022 RepID=A0A8L0DR96_ONCMY
MEPGIAELVWNWISHFELVAEILQGATSEQGQGQVCTELNSATCPTTLQCWKERASFSVPARIVNISQDVSVNEGGNVYLFCLAVGRPEPTVTWKENKYGLMSEGEFLDITEIKRHQAEEFECITNNGVTQPDIRKVKVTVNYPPMITDVKNMPAQLGKTAILRCEAMAVPTASFEWYRDDRRPVENDNTLRIKNEKTRSLLLFTNVTDKHFGNYTCFASNRLGASNASMLLFRPGAVYGRGVAVNVGVSAGVGFWLCLSVSLLMKV